MVTKLIYLDESGYHPTNLSQERRKRKIILSSLDNITKEDNLVICWLKYTFSPYFCQNYSIWSLFSLFGQFGPHFCKIAFNRVLLSTNVKIVNDTVTTWNCLGYMSNFCSDVGQHNKMFLTNPIFSLSLDHSNAQFQFFTQGKFSLQ